MFDYSTFNPEELFALAKIDFQRENYENSLRKLKVLLGRNQIPVQTYSLLGRVYASIGIFEKAKECFEVFVKNVPDAVEELFQLGMVEKDMGNADVAVSLWNDLLTKIPNFPPALYHKALVSIDKNETQDAVELLNLLLETAPEGDELIHRADQLLSKISLQ